MDNEYANKLGKELLVLFKMAQESVRQVALAEPDNEMRLHYLESTIKENETTNKPKLEEYLKLEGRDPEQERKILEAVEELNRLIDKAKNS